LADPLTAIVTVLGIMKQIGAVLPPNATQQQTEELQQSHYQLPQSLAEVGETVLKCYHKTGRFRSIDVIQIPWERGNQYSATNSGIFQINWNGGFLKTPYVMHVALVEREGEFRTVVQGDNAHIPYNKRCMFEKWTITSSAKNTQARNTQKIQPPPTNNISKVNIADTNGLNAEIRDLINAAATVVQSSKRISADKEEVDSSSMGNLAKSLFKLQAKYQSHTQ